ncbi:mitochondrial potassium channel ATP-binding subunit-like [Rhopilema esculentum]|uniref:mitochondrial potassium channel ATP-binding subunit-like n=1 Tax=Rhopilema esculentum TaxID=499914 RepID=UPI0031D9BDD0
MRYLVSWRSSSRVQCLGTLVFRKSRADIFCIKMSVLFRRPLYNLCPNFRTLRCHVFSQKWSSSCPLKTANRGLTLGPKFQTLKKNFQLEKLSNFLTNLSKNERFFFKCCGTISLIGGVSLRKKIANCEGLKLSHKSRIPRSKNEEKKDKDEDPEPALDWKLFFRLLLPDLWLFTLASLTAFLVALVNIKLPHLIGELINAISSLTQENSTGDNAFNVLYRPSVKLILNYGLQSGLTFLYITLLSSFGERFAARLRITLFESLVNQDIAFFDAHKTGEIVNRLTADIQDFKSSFKQCISQGVKSVTQTVGCVCMLYIVSPKLTSVMLVLLPGIVLFGTFLGSMLRKMSRHAQEQVAKATAVAEETLGNMRTVRAFAMEAKETEWYSDEVEKSKSLNEYLGAGIGVFQGLSNFAINGMTLVVLYYGGILLDSKQITPGDLMSFLMATQTIQRSLGTLSVLFGQVIRGLSSGARVFEYIQMKPKVELKHDKIIPTGSIHGHVRFGSVTFSYPTRPDQKVLDNLSLDIGAGKVIALCGPSGSGKSTIASLLENFYDLDSGAVTIDGYDVKELDKSWLRGDLIGFINQEPVLFAGTVKENIRYGKTDATDEEIYQAARLANADDFIRSFPDGYETIVGERGVTVSGGQKQRIAIARALIKNPKILILDEATSALDAESERIVQDALDNVSKGRTVLVIAHRLSTIINADLIAVISNGKIRETGTHRELLQKNGLYAELVRRQTSEKQKNNV